MNALNQAREFNKAVPLTGLIVTKLDGTSKGGMVVAIQKELGLPIKFIGLGEQPDDLQPFDAKQFAQALFEESEEGATLYVTLEPCCTRGRTPPCTEAIIAAGIKRVVVGATDPNPRHCGKAFSILKRVGIPVTPGMLAEECERLNQAFNHWIIHRRPFVTVKAAMTLDGKIATASGESKWITGPQSRALGMELRQGADAILVGINTILTDDPGLTVRRVQSSRFEVQRNNLRRIVLDARARTPLDARVVSDEHAALTTIVVSRSAPRKRVSALARRVRVVAAPLSRQRSIGPKSGEGGPFLDLRWLMKKLGAENVTSLLVEGGGEVNGSFLLGGLAHRIAFFYAPKILGGRDARKAVGGEGVSRVSAAIKLREVEWLKLGPDLLLSARVSNP